MTEIDAVHRSQRHTLPMALGALLATLVALMSSVSARAQAPAPGNAPPPAPEVGLALESRFEEFMRILNGDFARLQSDLFSAGFRETMPIGEFGETLKKQHAEGRGFKQLGVNRTGPYQVSAWLRRISDNSDWTLTLGVETQRPFGIDSLEMRARPKRSAAGYDGWALLDADLDAMIDRAACAVYELLPDGDMRAVHRYRANRRMAVGTAAKVWVLGALVERIEQGEAAWDQLLPIQGKLKSLPAQGFGTTPDGFDFPLREFAIRMFANNDTTAMDHLVEFLGRDAVGAVKTADRAGPDGPGSIVGAAADPADPFLSTLDLYRLTCSVDAQLIKRFAAGSVEERRRIVAEEFPRVQVMYELFEVWAKPQEAESVGWFATADQLSRGMARIWRAGQKPEHRQATIGALEAPESAAFDRDRIRYMGLNSGGHPGVFAGSWLIERTDGRVFVMTFIFNNPQTLLDDVRIGPAIEATQGLLARWSR